MIVACVWVGDKYPSDYVYRLRNMVAKHLSIPHVFMCLTDRFKELPGIVCVTYDDKYRHLPGWWAKMRLFSREWRADEKVVYIDLDTVIIDSLDPLASLDVKLGVCANFTRASGNHTWPCRYGSCVMVLGKDLDGEVWESFMFDRTDLMARAGKFGDQMALEWLYPNASFLQPLLPKNYFVGYRDFTAQPPKGCAIAVFAGNSKPDNSVFGWVRRAWMVPAPDAPRTIRGDTSDAPDAPARHVGPSVAPRPSVAVADGYNYKDCY